jgi:ABC-type amino acid transport substrate-binding protein
MSRDDRLGPRVAAWLVFALAVLTGGPTVAAAGPGAGAAADSSGGDLPAILARGELRHLGIRYANFVTGPDGGLDVEVARRFAEHLGVRYVFVESDWARIIPDLTGRAVVRDGARARPGAPRPVRGDLIATGMTRLPWREDLVAFSQPMFPTQIWLVAPARSSLAPIEPTDLRRDIAATRGHLDGLRVLAKPNTCLDPALYDLSGHGAAVVRFAEPLKFMAPAILAGEAEATILDVPDALVALARFPGRIKVIGPISAPQSMAAAFRPDAPRLRAAFDGFLSQLAADGTYAELVARHYPAVFAHFPGFFAEQGVVQP